MSLLQWNLYRETKCLPILFWIIQGKYGGHKWQLTDSEQKLLRLRTGLRVSDTACPGELPYAPFDGRVMRMLHRYNDLQTLDQRIMLQKKKVDKQRAGLIVNRQKSDEEQQARQHLSDWLELQVKQVVEDHLEPRLKEIWDEIPTGDRYYDSDRDQVERSFIEETSTQLEA